MPTVSALFIHPLKGATAIAVNEIALDEWGAVNDRRWMLLDADGLFLTQREVGSLALIGQEVQGSALLLTSRSPFATLPPMLVQPPPAHTPLATAIVWEADVLVQDAGDDAATWCSAVIGQPCRLVHVANESRRALQPKYAGSVNPEGRHVALSDGAPLLIVGESALAELNRRLAEKSVPEVPMNRFRPNVVFAGVAPHEEDTWHTIMIGNVTVGVGSKCPRCVVTTIDQDTGKRSAQRENEPGGEPLRTLASYRRDGSGVMFGVNATNATPGTIRIGDVVTVLEKR